MSGRCLEGVLRSLEVVWNVFRRYLGEGVWKVSGKFLYGVWKVSWNIILSVWGILEFF